MVTSPFRTLMDSYAPPLAKNIVNSVSSFSEKKMFTLSDSSGYISNENKKKTAPAPHPQGFFWGKSSIYDYFCKINTSFKFNMYPFKHIWVGLSILQFFWVAQFFYVQGMFEHLIVRHCVYTYILVHCNWKTICFTLQIDMSFFDTYLTIITNGQTAKVC